jgi:hypothetical protein
VLPEQVHGGVESLFLIELLCPRHCTVILFLERLVKYEVNSQIAYFAVAGFGGCQSSMELPSGSWVCAKRP